MLWLAQEFMVRVWTPIILYYPWVAPYISYHPVLETFALILLVVTLVASLARLSVAWRDNSLTNYFESKAPAVVSKFTTRVSKLVSKAVSVVKSWFK